MFIICLKNVIITLLYIIPGYVLCKIKKAEGSHLFTLSNLLVYFLSPCMIVNSFLSIEYSIDTLKNMGIFFVLTLVLQGIFFVILFLLFRKKYEDSKYRILSVATFLGNVGFYGLPIVRALFPTEPIVMCYSVIFSITMNIYVFTMVVYCLTLEKKYVSIKSALINPSIITLCFSLGLFFFKVNTFLPIEVLNAFDLFSKMTTPICMFILGVRLATVPFKQLITNWFAYLIVAGKLIVFPLFVFVIIYFLPLNSIIKAAAIILSACPCGSIILSMAEIYHKEEAMCANCVLLSTLISFMTIPVITLLIRLL